MKHFLAGMIVSLFMATVSLAAEPEPCVGDCNDDGRVAIAELVTCVNILLGNSPIEDCRDCDGDDDGRVEIHELVRSVGIALGVTVVDECTARSCTDSGGAPEVGLCCRSVGNFPDTCTVGACSCPPEGSHEVAVCRCGEGQCFDGSRCVPMAEYGCLDSGGDVVTGLCCLAVGNFPDTCSIGACSCPPLDSHKVSLCDCGEDRCFDALEMFCVKPVLP